MIYLLAIKWFAKVFFNVSLIEVSVKENYFIDNQNMDIKRLWII